MKIFTIPILILFLLPTTVSGNEWSLTIIYTGDIEGELEPCGCSPKTDFGGIARISGYINENRETLIPYIIVDAGNFSGEDTPQGRLKTEAILKAFSIMNYDAVALLEREKAFSHQFLSPVIERYKIPALSELPSYKKSILLRRGGVDINISVDQEDYKRGRLNILLTDRPVAEVRPLEGWDIVIVSSGEILEEPVRAKGKVIVSGYPKGKRLGILSVRWDNKKEQMEYYHEWKILGEDVKEDPEVRKIIDEYNSRVGRLSSSNVMPVEEGSYVGLSRCAECHQPFLESWKKTDHANAFISLLRKGKEKDPECLSCHTVGFGKKDGFINMEITPHLANVQCEACHGPGNEHIQDYSEPMIPITKDTCMKCHTSQNSPDFNYREYLKRIKH